MKCNELKVASFFEFEKVLQGRSNKLFYGKSEADAYIKELQKKIDSYDRIIKHQQLEIEEQKQVFDIRRKKLKHQKYKRCMAMAKWCNSEAYYAEAVENDDKRADWFGKWTDKFEKLAEHYKGLL